MLKSLRLAALIFTATTLMCLSGIAMAQQSDSERLTWMLDTEKCGDLVFVDVVELMHTAEDLQVRARAATGLGQYRGPEVFKDLYAVLARDRSPIVRAAALNALAAIMQKHLLPPGRDSMEAYFLVYQFDRSAQNRVRARTLLEGCGASAALLAERAYRSPAYQPRVPITLHAASDLKSKAVGTLAPADAFTIIDEAPRNNRKTCWFSVEGNNGLKGWLRGVADYNECFGTNEKPPRPFTSAVTGLQEITNPARPIALQLRSNKADDTFGPGEEFAFFVKADRNCYVTLIHFGAGDGSGYVLFPNKYQADTLLQAGREYRIPAAGTSMVFKAAPPASVEQVTAIATLTRIEIIPQHELEPGALQAIKTGRRDTARGIDRLLRYFDPAQWTAVHKVIHIVE